MKISIIIPAFNEVAGIARCVERAWEALPDEVIVVDGGSHDGTVALAERLNCRLLTSPRGRANQQNAGARAASGDVLLFLHADNWLAPAAVRQIRRALANAKIAGGVFRHRILAEGIAYRVLETGNNLRARVLRMAYGDQGIFLRRSIFEKIGEFPPVGLMEDVMLMRKLRRWPLAYLPGPLYASARRWKQNGVVRQTLKNWGLTMAEIAGVPPDALAPYYSPNGTKNGQPTRDNQAKP